MKKYNYIKGLVAVLLLTSAATQANEKYPASDFQPTVVYQDDAYIAKSGQTASSASSSSATRATTQQVDPKYPAANFEPKVVYNDPGYKHSSSSVSTATPSSTSTSESAGEKKSGDSSSSYMIGLILFAIAGYVFFKKRPESKPQSSSHVYSKDATGLTGVAKYLNRKSGTGVARYLEKQVKAAQSSAATGVAKYMAKQGGSSEATKAAAKTGVEKYLRNRS